MAHKELNLRERRTIEDMLNAQFPVREIAAQIGRHVSTVYREIKRNHYDDKELSELNGYYGMVAQDTATERRARPFASGCRKMGFGSHANNGAHSTSHACDGSALES